MSFGGKLALDEKKDKHSLVAIDTLKIDNHFRITFTKEVRNILPLKPGDTIALYMDGDNGDILLKLQRDSKIVNTLRITREGTDVNSSNVAVTIGRGRHFRFEGRTENSLNYGDSSTKMLDKATPLAAPQYYVDDPLKRYLPNIILIDDDVDILLTFQRILSEEGFSVKTFSRSHEALNYMKSHQSEDRVVMTDIRMPGLNGIELYRLLKSENKDIKVIFISALDAADELLTIFPEIKKQDIISKPIENNEFVSKVKAAIFSCLSFVALAFLTVLEQSSQYDFSL